VARRGPGHLPVLRNLRAAALSLTSAPDTAGARRRAPNARGRRTRLAGGEAVRLHDARWPRRPHRLGGRYARLAHHLLREGLRALDPRRGCGSAEDGDPVLAQMIGDPSDERHLGPITARSIPSDPASDSSPSPSSRGPGGTSLARRCPDCPALRGARSRSGSGRASRRSACSRPPDPTRAPSRGESTNGGGSVSGVDGYFGPKVPSGASAASRC